MGLGRLRAVMAEAYSIGSQLCMGYDKNCHHDQLSDHGKMGKPWLREQFGAEYDKYCKRVRRFL